jgi:hypothetical protein
MATDLGPATGSGVLFAGQTASIEVHVGNPPSVNLGNIQTGVDPFPPTLAPFVDPNVAPTLPSGSFATAVNKTIVFTGAPGTTQTVVNPA